MITGTFGLEMAIIRGLAISSWKEGLTCGGLWRSMTPEQAFKQLMGLGKSWRLVEARFEPQSFTFFLKVEETPELWPEESIRWGIPATFPNHVEPL